MNSVVLIGRLARDPDLKFLPSGMAVTRISLAVDKELFGDKKQEAINKGNPTADFISVTVFGKQAESCANYLAKGSMCAVNGRINTGSYTTQSGEKRYTTDVIANRIEFIGSKQSSSSSTLPGKPTNSDSNFFDNFPDDDNDIFQPVDEDDIPF
jgi:single-strand DNA-binding protein